jgi:hypothetical protein
MEWQSVGNIPITTFVKPYMIEELHRKKQEKHYLPDLSVNVAKAITEYEHNAGNCSK